MDVKNGLSKEEISGRIEKYGYNELKEKEKESIWVKITKQLKNFPCDNTHCLPV